MKTVLSWFVRNSVAANLLMLMLLGGGLLYMRTLRLQVFPEFASELISIAVEYPGATPAEIEEAICIPVEEQVRDLEAIKRLRAVAAEGIGHVTIELLQGSDAQAVLEKVRSRIDAIDSFPEDVERPVVEEVVLRRQVLSVVISGDVDELTLKRLGQQTRDDLANLPGLTQVELLATRPFEISIEVSELALRRYRLTFDEVATAVRKTSLDIPAGSLKAQQGEILVRSQGQAYSGDEFAALVLRTEKDGTQVTLGDVATVRDGFAETDRAARFDSHPAVIVQVYRIGRQSAPRIAALVEDYLESARQKAPAGIALTVWQDDTQVLKSRLETLTDNGLAGLVLVLIVLALFLKPRLAFWVAIGLPISLLGALWVMALADLSINVMSLFAFIIVLGILVDDAIVVGENIYRHYDLGKEGLDAAVDGVKEVASPVICSALTTIAAFAPLLFIPGLFGSVMRIIPLVVIVTLAVSLLESLLILPSHLAHLRASTPPSGGSWIGSWQRFQSRWAEGFDRFTLGLYQPLLARALRWRYTTLALGLAVLLLSFGFVIGGHLEATFFTPVEADHLVALLTLPQGSPPSATLRVLERLESSARRLREELAGEGEANVFGHVLVSIGDQPSIRRESRRSDMTTAVESSHLGEVTLELESPEKREVSAQELLRRWRELTGPQPEVEELTFHSAIFTVGKPIHVQLAGHDLDVLEQAAHELKDALTRVEGLLDISDTFRPGKQEVRLTITPKATALGLSQADLGRQLRQALYGEEVQRLQRGADEVKVMVRYPAAERRSLAAFESMRLRTADGEEIPLSFAGRQTFHRGLAAIDRTNRRRTIDVTAELDRTKLDAKDVIAELERSILPEIQARYSGLSYSFQGEQQEQKETLGGLLRSLTIALFAIYALLAIPLRSYAQPLIIMCAIPFGVVGAFLGHFIMGKPLAIQSAFGIVAVIGIIVNDSLVLVDFINRARRQGVGLRKAIRLATKQRLRPIVLTSMTTFAGLTPLLLERSLQAQLLIPMAISVAFGVLFATIAILFLVPVIYLVIVDVRRWARRRSDEITEVGAVT